MGALPPGRRAPPPIGFIPPPEEGVRDHSTIFGLESTKETTCTGVASVLRPACDIGIGKLVDPLGDRAPVKGLCEADSCRQAWLHP